MSFKNTLCRTVISGSSSSHVIFITMRWPSVNTFSIWLSCASVHVCLQYMCSYVSLIFSAFLRVISQKKQKKEIVWSFRNSLLFPVKLCLSVSIFNSISEIAHIPTKKNKFSVSGSLMEKHEWFQAGKHMPFRGKKTDAWFWDVECMILNFDVICVHTYI